MIDTSKQLWDASDIAELAGVCPRTVLERWSKNPDFPEAVYMPTGAKGRARKRWRKLDIYRYFKLTEDSKKS